MQEIETIYFINRADWRNWLLQNFEQKVEIWLEYPKKKTGKERITYNDAVEEALCFGWIDSTVKAWKEDTTIQRFCLRKATSSYSQANKERLRWLLDEGLVHASIREEVARIAGEVFVFPEDIRSKLKSDSVVWTNFQAFSEPYKRIRIAYIEGARKRPEEFSKRLANFIAKTRENKQIKGFGGIDKYY